MKKITLILIGLLFANPLQAACGIDGTLDERILDCDLIRKDKSNNQWNLVSLMYSNSGSKVRTWYDQRSHSIWVEAFVTSQVIAKEICTEDFKNKVPGMMIANWSIASVDDYKYLETSEAINSILDGRQFGQFWTDVDMQMVSRSSWEVYGNHPDNSNPVICRAYLTK